MLRLMENELDLKVYIVPMRYGILKRCDEEKETFSTQTASSLTNLH